MNDTRYRRARLEDHLAEIIRHIPNFHPLLDIGAAPDQRVKHPGLLAGNGHDLVNPYRVFDHRYRPGQHFQISHHVERSCSQRADIVGFDCAGMACLNSY